MASGTDWTDDELEAAVEAYLRMLRQEQDGKPYSKADLNQSLRDGALFNRTKASIEYRMQNISAVLDDIGHPRVHGYAPAQNVGEGVKARIRQLLEAKGIRPSPDYAPTADEGEFQRRVSKLRKVTLPAPPTGQEKPATVETSGKAYVRDPVVKAWVLQNAHGKCEACGERAPFTSDDGEPYFESHHVRPLADGGSDKVTNTVALCPNCHRRCHFGSDRHQFTDALYLRVTRLIRE